MVMLPNFLKKYSPIPPADNDGASSKAFLSKDEGDEHQPIQCHCQQAIRRRSQLRFKAVVMVVLIALVVINLAFVIVKYRPTDKACAKQLGSYCRVIEYL
jgi:hypothetical protein